MAGKSLFVNMSIHRPHPEKENLLTESMHRYGEAARHQKGLVFVCPPLKDTSSGELVGIAIWDSEEAFQEAGPALTKATEGDDFDSWEAEPIRSRRLKPA